MAFQLILGSYSFSWYQGFGFQLCHRHYGNFWNYFCYAICSYFHHGVCPQRHFFPSCKVCHHLSHFHPCPYSYSLCPDSCLSVSDLIHFYFFQTCFCFSFLPHHFCACCQLICFCLCSHFYSYCETCSCFFYLFWCCFDPSYLCCDSSCPCLGSYLSFCWHFCHLVSFYFHFFCDHSFCCRFFLYWHFYCSSCYYCVCCACLCFWTFCCHSCSLID